MEHKGSVPGDPSLKRAGITDAVVNWNLLPEELADIAVRLGQAVTTSTGAIAVDTGEFKGRAPRDRFIVRDIITDEEVWWNDINIPFDPDRFDRLLAKVGSYLSGGEIFARDVYACADPTYRVRVRVITEHAWSNLFAYNMFVRPNQEELADFVPDWLIIQAPGFQADPNRDGTRQRNFSIINFSRKIILIGGTGYTGEIKKGMFSALNFILPRNYDVLPMHCAANMGESGDVALFFGLSGTGKTTLSTDTDRRLIGDDEHGWTPHNTIFNFEGGCYAKVIRLSEEGEPHIYRAIRKGALLENVCMHPGTNDVNFDDASLTENTRVSYPLHHIENSVIPSVGGAPSNIFFLACDAFGVLPPISRLTPKLATYFFMSGYTAKVAGTETGVSEPTMTFSACFGAPFMPLHPNVYAEMFRRKIKDVGARVWLVNTGWTGGSYGSGKRIALNHTRALVRAALSGALDTVAFRKEEHFGVEIPLSCPGVPDEILDPASAWPDREAYANKAAYLVNAMKRNYDSLWALPGDTQSRGELKIASR
ncbi:MAG TPA: phosphoenolpyruvate carboxykinase (ATP) [Cyclobacteriaceae bacterium]|jgi:phosphoenolpyruvate carboxykinase (ATP)